MKPADLAGILEIPHQLSCLLDLEIPLPEKPPSGSVEPVDGRRSGAWQLRLFGAMRVSRHSVPWLGKLQWLGFAGQPGERQQREQPFGSARRNNGKFAHSLWSEMGGRGLAA